MSVRVRLISFCVLSPSSNGQDTRFSSWQYGFDSRWRCQPFYGALAQFGQSVCMACRRSSVRTRYAPPSFQNTVQPGNDKFRAVFSSSGDEMSLFRWLERRYRPDGVDHLLGRDKLGAFILAVVPLVPGTPEVVAVVEVLLHVIPASGA